MSQGSLVFGKRFGFGLQRKPRDAGPQASMASEPWGLVCKMGMKSTTRLLGGLQEMMDFQASGNRDSPEKDEQAHPRAPETQVASDLLSANKPCLWGLS